MILNAVVFGFGSHEAAWRHPDVDPTAPLTLAHWIQCAQQAEAAGFDGLFLGDILCLQDRPEDHPSETLDPFMVLAAVAGATSRLRLTGTASTSFNHPWHLARRILSLHHLSAGRAGWNIVTSSYPQEAENFGWPEMPGTEERYARAEEVVAAVRALWSGWDGITRLADQAAGRWLDATPPRVDAMGRFGAIHGTLNLSPPPGTGRCWRRPGPRPPVLPSRHATPTRCLPCNPTCPRPGRSGIAHGRWPQPRAETPKRSRCCPASFPSWPKRRRPPRRSWQRSRSA